MAHSHEHHHEHVHELTSLNKSFIIGITLNILFVLVEFGIGFYYDSLGLLSDAGHNLGDVASLVLAMLAFRLARCIPTVVIHTVIKRVTVLVSQLSRYSSGCRRHYHHREYREVVPSRSG